MTTTTTTTTTTSSSSSKSNDHPMVPVPEAVRIVLQETTRILISGGKPQPVETVSLFESSSPISSKSSSNLHTDLVQRVVANDVLMSEPGYPPYNASIMDGYAIKTHEFPFLPDSSTATTDDDENTPTHRVIDKVYAGDGEQQPQHQQQQPPHESSSSSSTTTTTTTTTLPSAYYITTGAVVPDGYNCVVPIEEVKHCPNNNNNNNNDNNNNNTTNTTTMIRIVAPSSAITDQKWIRPIGCDIPPKSVVIPAGHVMDPVGIGLLRQSGSSTIDLKRRTKVGVLSTGNELITVEDHHHDNDHHDTKNAAAEVVVGKIPDVNRPILLSLLESYGRGCIEVIDLGMVRDDNVTAMTTRIRQAMDTCDVIITTGGVSMGETDIVEHVLVDQCGGTLHFGRMMMKPGKPTTFVTVPHNNSNNNNHHDDDESSTTKIVFALPGNPVSATVCTQLLVKPCLDLYFNFNNGNDNNVVTEQNTLLDDVTSSSIMNITDRASVHPEVMAKLSHDIKLDPKRPEYHRVTLQQDLNGTFWASSTGIQRSSRLMSLRDATGLLVLPSATHGMKTVALKGEEYLVLVLNYNNSPSYVTSDTTIRPVQVKDSIHLKKKGKQMKIGVVEVIPPNQPNLSNLHETCLKIQNSLSGSKSGTATVVWKTTYTGPSSELYDYMVNETLSSASMMIDFIIVVCVMHDGSFVSNLDVSTKLKHRLTKCANSMALQVRKGAASIDPTSAIFEVVVGYMSTTDTSDDNESSGAGGSMVVCTSDRGISGALSNVRGLLKHGLNLARGKPHNHHHTHKDHDHEIKKP